MVLALRVNKTGRASALMGGRLVKREFTNTWRAGLCTVPCPCPMGGQEGQWSCGFSRKSGGAGRSEVAGRRQGKPAEARRPGLEVGWSGSGMEG